MLKSMRNAYWNLLFAVTCGLAPVAIHGQSEPQISFGSAGDVVVLQDGKTVRYLYDGTIRLQDAPLGPIDIHYTGNSAAKRSKETLKSIFMTGKSLGASHDLNAGNSWEFSARGMMFYRLCSTCDELRSQSGRYNSLALDAVKNAQAALDFAATHGKPLSSIAAGLPALRAFNKQQ